MSVGGPSSVRAYDAGTLSGDSVLRWTAEWRTTLAATEYGTWCQTQFRFDTAVERKRGVDLIHRCVGRFAVLSLSVLFQAFSGEPLNAWRL